MNLSKRRLSLRALLATVIALVAPFVLLLVFSLTAKIVAASGPFDGPFVAWGVSALFLVLSVLCFLSVIAFPIACVAFYYQLFMLFVAPNKSVALTAPAPGLMNLQKPE